MEQFVMRRCLVGERLLTKTPELEESVSTDGEWKNGLSERKQK
jgi:hypothetical protein